MGWGDASSAELTLFLQTTSVQFPAPISGASQLPIPPAPGKSSSGLHRTEEKVQQPGNMVLSKIHPYGVTPGTPVVARQPGENSAWDPGLAGV